MSSRFGNIWLVQEQKINTTEFERERFVSLRLRIFLTASALAGARAKNKYNQVRSIEFNRSLERPICEFKVCVYF